MQVKYYLCFANGLKFGMIMSEKTPVYIKDVLIKDFKCFKGENVFSFVDEKGDWCRWTVFLGNNNTGKTNLLKAIAALEPSEVILNTEKIKNFKSYFPLGYEKKFFYKDKSFEHGINTTSSLLLDNFELMHNATGTARGLPKIVLSIYGYGVIRNIELPEKIKTDKEKLNADNLFYNSSLIDFEDWYLQLDYGAKNNILLNKINISTK